MVVVIYRQRNIVPASSMISDPQPARPEHDGARLVLSICVKVPSSNLGVCCNTTYPD
jgi:hypothetical protein